MNKIILPIVIILVVLIGYKWLSRPPVRVGVPDDQAELLLFWGEGCPHCKNVEDYITQNKAGEKIKIAYKEVYYNKANQALMTETVKNCPEIDTSQGMGVPLAYAKSENKCFYGDQPIISWLQNRMLQ